MERRQFLKVLGVSGAGTALAGCGAGESERLIPYLIPHEEIVPGMATWYRTTCRECPAGCGMNLRTREGRAVKAEGNPLSPISHGALCARGQASLHGLYDPDRVPQAVAREGETWSPITWDDAEQRVAQALAQNRGRAAFLTRSAAGTMDQLIDDFCAAFGIERVRWEPFALEPIRTANRMLFGVDALPVHDFARAEILITFGADFLETWISPVDYAHGFTEAHAYNAGRRGRLISVTPHQSLTDMNADEWLAVRPGTEHLIALALARLVADQSGAASAQLGTVDVAQAAETAGVEQERLLAIARAFANGGRSLAVGPGVATTSRAATALAAAVATLNSVAGNYGSTVFLDRREQPAVAPTGAAAAQAGGQAQPAAGAQPAAQQAAAAPAGSYAAMQQLIARMQAGEIGALLVHGPNPMYDMPEADAVEQALAQVGFVASFSPYLDETTTRAQVVVPDHHFLESWDDYVPRSGVTALVQPVMQPVFDTKQTGDVLLSVATRANVALPNAAPTYYEYLRGRWSRDVLPAATPADFEATWRDALKVGFVADGATQPGTAPAASDAALAQLGSAVPEFSGDDGYFLVVYPSYKYYDGRLANRLWLQELPDPISKFAWSSWVEVHPEVGAELGIDTGSIVEVTTQFGSATLPVWLHPGMRSDTIAIQLGQGHTAFGRWARDRGVNAYRLIGPVAEQPSGGLVYAQTRATLRPTGDWDRPIQAGLENTQHGREIARAMTVEDARSADAARGLPIVAAVATPPAAETAQTETAQAEEEHAEGGHAEEQHPLDAEVRELQGSGGFSPATVDASPMGFPPPGTHYGEYSKAQPRWGMTIDLDRCTGCSACITACYAENNIGVVGPDLVAQGRIMHWIRLERYFEGEGDHVQTRFLPMLCQQCGNAPCEPVCPVFAAYHTPDGLNGQVYNRCVGTRYCANNCPYKVRTFNWFSWEWPEPLNWQLNPDVTVREKGVMEKCTFCVQRIRDAENNARLEDRGVRDGEIVPACEQTCPTQAIVFGNMRDPNSRVRRFAESGRAYRVLDQLNTQSAIVYLEQVVPETAEG